MIGHLKFMQLFLNEIFEKVKQINKGDDEDKPYDEDSKMFDWRRDYESLVDDKHLDKKQSPASTADNTGMYALTMLTSMHL